MLGLQINSQSLEDAKALGQKSLGPVNSKIGPIFKNETDVMWRVSITDTVQGCYMAVQGGYMAAQGGYMAAQGGYMMVQGGTGRLYDGTGRYREVI